MTVPGFHNDIFEHLIKRDIRFKPRIQRGARTQAGYWFIGDDTYLNLSFWDGYDQLRNIHRLGFGYSFDRYRNTYLILSAKDHADDAAVLAEMAVELGARKDRQGLWIKDYGFDVTDSGTVIQHLEQFIKEDLPIIDRYVDRLQSVSHITRDKFEKNVTKINEVRATMGLAPVPLTPRHKHRKKMRSRHGVHSREVETYLRTTMATEVEVTPRHNELQNQMYAQLKRDYPDAYLVMEENFIDLQLDTGDSLHLIEVKPYTSVTRCIREGIGQLLQYYSDNCNGRDDIVLVIAGPEEPGPDDRDFIRFIQDLLTVDFDYHCIS